METFQILESNKIKECKRFLYRFVHELNILPNYLISYRIINDQDSLHTIKNMSSNKLERFEQHIHSKLELF